MTKHTLPSPLTYFKAEEMNRHIASVNAHTPLLSNIALQSTLFIPSNATNSSSFKFHNTTIDEFHALIRKASSKAIGPDGISSQMLKFLPYNAIEIFTALINYSLSNGTFPSSWKQALIVPIAKVKNIKSLKDTRPISILPEMSKIMERIVFNQLSAYLEKNKLLIENQSGFRKGHSTQIALLKVCDDIRLAINNRMITILVLFDFSKAFDLVPHTLLLEKL